MSCKDGMSRSIPHFPNCPGWPTARQTDKEDLHEGMQQNSHRSCLHV